MKTKITLAGLHALESGHLENFIAASTPGGIEAQEKRGQIEQSFAETLPIAGTSSEEQRKNFEALGFVFALDRTAAQNQGRGKLFVDCKFPKGWRKKPTDHSMYSDIVDEQGRKRGVIFYKAAFYDKRADCHLTRRYGCGTEPEGGWLKVPPSKRFVGVVRDGDTVIFTTDPTPPEPNYRGQGDESNRQAWLDWQQLKDAKGERTKRRSGSLKTFLTGNQLSPTGKIIWQYESENR